MARTRSADAVRDDDGRKKTVGPAYAVFVGPVPDEYTPGSARVVFAEVDRAAQWIARVRQARAVDGEAVEPMTVRRLVSHPGHSVTVVTQSREVIVGDGKREQVWYAWACTCGDATPV